MYLPHPRADPAAEMADAHLRRPASLAARRQRDADDEDLRGAAEAEAEAEAEAAAAAACAAGCGMGAAAAGLWRPAAAAAAAAKEGGGGGGGAKAGRNLSRAEKGALVERARADGEDALLQRLQYRVERAGVPFLGVTVSWDRLTVTRRARAAGQGLPSVFSPVSDAAAAMLRACGPSPSSSAATKTSSSALAQPNAPATAAASAVDALCDASGVLRPATSTLLLGAPGSGKTTLLRALSGRLQASGAIVHVGLRRRGATDSGNGLNGNGNGIGGAISGAPPPHSSAPPSPHYWLRYNGAPAAPPSTGTGAGVGADALASCGCAGGGGGGADSDNGNNNNDNNNNSIKKRSGNKPAFEVPAVATYVDQAELSCPALTVRETLEFAERCQGADAPSLAAVREMLRWEGEHADEVRADDGGPSRPAVDEPLDAMLRAVAEQGGQGQQLIAEWTLRSLRLEHAADTPVGDAMLRGVSGGERRRVALGEALVGPALFFALDEVTTGLDSASALEVAQSLRRSARAFRVTVLCALLQPDPAVVAAFDDLLLLARGRVLYHGPVDGALPHFAALGLNPAKKQDPAEFLAGLAADDDAEAARLSAAFWSGDAGAALRAEAQAAAAAATAGGGPPSPSLALASIAEEGGGGKDAACVQHALGGGGGGGTAGASAAGTGLPKRPHAALSTVVRALFRRTFALEVARNWEAIAIRGGLGALMAAVLGTLFLRLPATQAGGAAVVGVLVAALDFFAVLSMPTAHATLVGMPLLLRQRDARYFPSWALLLPQQLVSVACLLLDLLSFAVPLYFLVGLSAASVAFFRYLVVIFCFAACLDSMYRMFGALATSVPITVSVMTVLFLLFNALAGYSIAATAIPLWWRWLYWLNPFAWALRSLAINELTQERWRAPIPPEALAAAGVLPGDLGAPRTVGDGLLDLYQMIPGGRGSGGASPDAWVWAGAAVLAAETICFLLVTWWGYARRRPPVPPVDVAPGPDAPGELDESPTKKSASRALPLPPVLPISVGASGRSNNNKGKGANDDDDDDDADDQEDDSALTMLPPVSVAFLDLCYYVPHPNPAAARAAHEALAAAAAAAAPPAAKEEQQQPQPCPAGWLSRRRADDDARAHARPELQLLRGVTGHFVPGRVAALMGASGAGKTTLLDVLALRKTVGRVTGHLAVGGRDPRADRARFSSVSGYCEQSSDLHVGLATVREAVVFCAQLRLRRQDPAAATPATATSASASASTTRQGGKETPARRRRRVAAAADAALAVVGLTPQAGVLVQSLSLEQNKRLTIAVELAARPSVLFLDEPTSGLDSGGAWAVARALRAVAARGGTVVCTVHQPGDALFRYAFDDLLLLRRGGSIAYFGPLALPLPGVFVAAAAADAAAGRGVGGGGGDNGEEEEEEQEGSCSALAAYFGGVEGRVLSSSSAADADGGPLLPPLLPGQNPAAWAIEVVAERGGGGGGAGKGLDLGRAWRESEQARAARDRTDALLGGQEPAAAATAAATGGTKKGQEAATATTATGATATPATTPAFAVGSVAQFSALATRNLRAQWRHPARNLSRLVYAFVAAVLLGTIYLGRASLSRAAALHAASGDASSSSPLVVSTRDVLNAAGSFFLVVVALCMESAYAAQEGIALERAPYLRERASGLYSPGPYLLAQIAAELPWCLAAVVAFVSVIYFLLGCVPTAAAFFYFLACGFLGVAAVFLVAQLLVHVSRVLFVATLAMSVAATAQQAIGGLYRTRPSAPAWFAWAYWINPLWYTFAGLVGSQLGGETRLVVGDASAMAGGAGGGGAALEAPPTVAEFVSGYFGVDAGPDGGLTTPGACLGMLGVLCAAAAAASYVALRTLNYQKR